MFKKTVITVIVIDEDFSHDRASIKKRYPKIPFFVIFHKILAVLIYIPYLCCKI